MADPLSAVASHPALLCLALQSGRKGDNRCANFDRIERGLRIFSPLKGTEAGLGDPDVAESVSRALVAAVRAQLDTIARQPSSSRLEKLWKRKRHGENAETIRNLESIVSALHVGIVFRLPKNLQENRGCLCQLLEAGQQVKDVATLKDELLSSLSNCEDLLQRLDADKSDNSRQDELVKARFEDTGKWVFGAPEFVSWKNGKHPDSQVLWISGPPGSGKSVLMSTIIEWALGRASKWKQEAVVYFYFEASGKTTTLHALSSLLDQLLQREIKLPSSISAFLESYGRPGAGEEVGSSPPFNSNEATSAFLTLSREFKAVTICLDGLDECSDIDDLLRLLGRILESSCRLVVASQPWERFVQFFFGKATIDMTNGNTEDIRQYFRKFLKDNPRLAALMGDTFSSEAEDLIKQRSGGSFLWTGIQMKQLLQLTRRAEVKEYLHHAPTGLEETYKLLLRRIKEQSLSRVDLASGILTWLTIPDRLLTLSELQHALSIDSDCEATPSTFDTDRIPPIWAMEEVCMGLVTINESQNSIKLSHHSLGEFLFRSSQLDGLSEIHSTDYVLLCCIACLRIPELAFGPCDTVEAYEQRISRRPLVLYVAESWGNHLKKSPDRSAKFKEILGVLENSQYSDALVQLMHIGRRRDGNRNVNQFPKDFTAIHMAAHFDLDFALDDQPLASYLDHRINDQDSWGRTALHIAAQRGQESVCGLLLAKGAKIDIKDANDDSPLHHAVSSGHFGTARLLLKPQMSSISEREGSRLLQTAAQRGHLDIVYLLLDSRTIQATKETVYLAAAQGYFDIAELLIDHGGSEGVNRAMLEAARQGAARAALRLFELGADVNATDDEEKMTALHHAVVHNQTPLIARLLSLGADPEARDAKDRTPLFIGAEKGHSRVVEELLRGGAVMDAVDIQGRTPLDAASAGGHVDTVQILCSHGRLPQTNWVATQSQLTVEPGEAKLTALQVASFHGFNQIVGILLANGADPDQRGRTNRTPLSYAAEAGHRAVVKRLLDLPTVHVNALDPNHRTPLSYAAEHGHVQIVHMFLARRDIDPSLPDSQERTALSYAEVGAHHDIAFLLGLLKADTSEPETELDHSGSKTSI